MVTDQITENTIQNYTSVEELNGLSDMLLQDLLLIRRKSMLGETDDVNEEYGCLKRKITLAREARKKIINKMSVEKGIKKSCIKINLVSKLSILRQKNSLNRNSGATHCVTKIKHHKHVIQKKI